MLNVIVAGGRDFTSEKNYEMMKSWLLYFFKDLFPHHITIVSGMAAGADSLAIRFAKEHGLQVKEFPADWKRFGKSAGYKRNVQMAEFADACVCFWNQHSKGTKHMIDIAKERELKLRVVKY